MGERLLWGTVESPCQAKTVVYGPSIARLAAYFGCSASFDLGSCLRKLFQHAIQVHRQRGQMSPAQFDKQVAHIERTCDRLLQQDLAPPEAQKLQRRYLKYRACLFVFLHRNDVEPTNNVAERALRHSVVHRKVTNGFRSHWGTKTYAALASVIDTAELTGVRCF